MFFNKLKYIIFLNFVFSEEKIYLDRIVDINGLFYSKSDQSLVSAEIYFNIKNKDFY